MSELIEAIRAAVAQNATTDQKAIGAQACRTILAALDAIPGKPIVLPGAPKPHPLSGITVDQALDLLIARLTMIANARDVATAPPANTAQQTNTAQPGSQGPQVPPVFPSATKGTTTSAASRPAAAPKIPLVVTPPRPVHAVPKKR